MTIEIPIGVIPANEKSGPIVNIVTKQGVVEQRLPLYVAISRGVSKETGASIEVHRRVDMLPMYQDEKVLNAIATMKEDMTIPEILDHVVAVGNVVSIELRDKNGLGTIVYFER